MLFLNVSQMAQRGVMLMPTPIRYISLVGAVCLLIVICYFGFVQLQKILDRAKSQKACPSGQMMEVNPNILERVELKTTYKYLIFFPPDSILFEHPMELEIDLKAGNAPLRKGKIKFDYLQRIMGDANRVGYGTGAGQFEDIEIQPLNPNERRVIKKTIPGFAFMERLLNPVLLNLVVYDSQGNRTGHQTVRFDLKTKAEAREEVRGALIFWTVVMTCIIAFVTLLIAFLTFLVARKSL